MEKSVENEGKLVDIIAQGCENDFEQIQNHIPSFISLSIITVYKRFKAFKYIILHLRKHWQIHRSSRVYTL
jgi:hypothetical protein